MQFDYKLEIRDVVLGLGIFASIITSSVTSKTNTENAFKQIEETNKRIERSENNITKEINVNIEQTLLLREISINVNNVAETVKELKQSIKPGKYTNRGG